MIKIISEIGSNHNGDLNRCKQLIKESRELGFAAVKLQLFKADLLTKNKSLIKEYKKQELDVNWLPEISKYCKELEMLFGVSVFYNEAVDEVKDYIDFFKISSFDILRADLIKKCLESKKDVYISCGLATNQDVANVLDLILTYGNSKNNYYLMHCVSKYPAHYSNSYIKRITEIFMLILQHKKQNIFAGYSDHTKDIDVIKEALGQFAQCVEMHFDLDDGLGSESKYGHCWQPKDVDQLYEKMSKINSIINEKFILTEADLNMRADAVSGLRS